VNTDKSIEEEITERISSSSSS